MALELITSDALSPLRHGFFTRKGGASSGLYTGLNCGMGSSDQTDVVAINRTRVAHALGGTAADLISPNQIHSDRAVQIDAPMDLTVTPRPDADGVVTTTPGLILLILTADCAPVLFADQQAGVVAAAHSGWRGAFDGVLQSTIAAMEQAGARRERITAVVGPTISQPSYEVGQEFLDRFLDRDPGNARYFVNGATDKYHFDLPMFICNTLRGEGIAHAEWSRHCTYADPDRFFSYRRSVHQHQPDYGRLAAAIRL